MAVSKIIFPGLVDGATSRPAMLSVYENDDGTVSLNVGAGGTAKLYLAGLVDGAAQSTPISLLATDNGGGVFTLNAS